MFQNKVFIALGSNVGNWKINFNKCLKQLKKIGQLKAIGNIYISKPYGYEYQENFYNTAVELHTFYQPKQLIKKIQFIENILHKKKEIKNGPRRIDIDIIFFNSLKFNSENLVIPHPRANSRDFVIYPLCDINPLFKHPIEKKSLKNLKNDIEKNYIEKKIKQPKDLFLIH